MDQKPNATVGIAEYLEQFDRSPYRDPAQPHRGPVQGVSTLKGSWFQERRG